MTYTNQEHDKVNLIKESDTDAIANNSVSRGSKLKEI